MPERLSPAAAAVRTELRETVRTLVQTGRWPGVELLAPNRDGDLQAA
jgi:LysR family transcriptional regulator, regulatory protein for tcuABC